MPGEVAKVATTKKFFSMSKKRKVRTSLLIIVDKRPDY